MSRRGPSPAIASRLLPRLLVKTLLACDSDGTRPPPIPRVEGDSDADGFAPPEDWLDGPFTWASRGPERDGSVPLRLLAADGTAGNDSTFVGTAPGARR